MEEILNISKSSGFSVQEIEYFLDKLREYSKGLHLDVSDDQLLLCIHHLLLVIETNKRFNLTRILNIDDALVLHILDSLSFAPYIVNAPTGDLLDIGTGAGFPAIPLAIASNRATFALDSVGKKVDAVASFVSELGLCNLHAVHDRVESFALDNRNRFSCVVSRAVASLPVLIEYAAPLLCDQGLLVVSKGKPSQDEIDSGFQAARICGFQYSESHQFDLPDDLGHRNIFIFQKVRSPYIKLPRAIGLARKKPLA